MLKKWLALRIVIGRYGYKSSFGANNNKEDNDIKEEEEARRAKGGPKGLRLEVGARRAPELLSYI